MPGSILGAASLMALPLAVVDHRRAPYSFSFLEGGRPRLGPGARSAHRGSSLLECGRRGSPGGRRDWVEVCWGAVARGAGWIVFSVVWGRLRAAMSIASRIRDVHMLSAIA